MQSPQHILMQIEALKNKLPAAQAQELENKKLQERIAVCEKSAKEKLESLKSAQSQNVQAKQALAAAERASKEAQALENQCLSEHNDIVTQMKKLDAQKRKFIDFSGASQPILAPPPGEHAAQPGVVSMCDGAQERVVKKHKPNALGGNCPPQGQDQFLGGNVHRGKGLGKRPPKDLELNKAKEGKIKPVDEIEIQNRYYDSDGDEVFRSTDATKCVCRGCSNVFSRVPKKDKDGDIWYGRFYHCKWELCAAQRKAADEANGVGKSKP